jgi:hypothetical protein
VPSRASTETEVEVSRSSAGKGGRKGIVTTNTLHDTIVVRPRTRKNSSVLISLPLVLIPFDFEAVDNVKEDRKQMRSTAIFFWAHLIYVADDSL